MPSQAQPSLRDGRLPPSPLPPGKDAVYYSNRDIELLYEIVCKGQDILPTLPRRDRLPTSALFHAADRIFPLYGLDPSTEDKLTRIIFLIGGMRSTDDLRERFRTVLARMGIELEFVPDSSQNDNDEDDDGNEAGDQDDDASLPASDRSRHRKRRLSYLNASPPSPHPLPPRSVRSAVPSSAALSTGGAVSAYSARSGAFPVAPRVTGRRRRNSDSNAQFVATADAHRPDHGHLGPFGGNEDHDAADVGVQHSDGSDDEAGDIVQQPRLPQQRRKPPQHRRRRSDSLAPPRSYGKPHHDQAYEEPRSHAQHAPRSIDPWLSAIPSFPHATGEYADQEMTGSSEHDYDDEEEEDFEGDEDPSYHSGNDDGFGRRDHNINEDGLDEYTRSLQLLRPPARQQNRDDPDDDTSSSHVHHHHALALRTRPFHPQLQQQRQQKAPSLQSASVPTARSSTGRLSSSPQSHVSPVSGVAEFYGASDTTVQEEFEIGGPAPKVDPTIMAKVADTFFWRFAFLRGLAIANWRSLTAACQEQEHYAAQMDREWSASEALLEWSDRAGTHLHETTEKAVDDSLARRADSAPKDVLELEHAQAHDTDPNDDAAADVNADAEVDTTDSDATDEATALARQKDEERRRWMGWAASVDAIRLKSFALVRWQAMAQLEVERTGVARRHLLRRKVFDAWRGQAAADDCRVDDLAKRWAVRHWADMLQHAREEDALVAGPLYRRSLAIHAYCTWQRTYQERTANAMRVQRPKVEAIRRWHACTAAAVGLVTDAARRDVMALCRRAMDCWDDQVRTHMIYNLRIDESNCETHYKVALRAWTQAVFYETRLRAFLTARATEKKETVVTLWRQSTAVLQGRREKVDRDAARKHAKHWLRVTKLDLYVAEDEHKRKKECFRDWQCAYHFAALSRHHEDLLARKACQRLQSAYEQNQDPEPIQVAVRLDCKSLVSGMVVPAARAQCAANAAQQQTAEHMAYAARAVAGLQSLAQGIAWHADMDVLARRGAYYVAVVNALDGWAAHARNVREQRLRSSYHQFRRVVKRQAARGCVVVWRAALQKHTGAAAGTDDPDDPGAAGGAHGRADGYAQAAVRLQSKIALETVLSTLNHWILATNDCLFRQAVAAEADAEVYLSTWRLQHAEAAEWAAAAAEHDAAVQLAGRWDDWELQAVQARARAHTAAALHEKNDRRLGRRALWLWQQHLMERWADEADDRDGEGNNGFEDVYGDDDDPDTSLQASSASRHRSRWLVPIAQHGHGLSQRSLLQSSTGSTGSRWRPSSSFPTAPVGPMASSVSSPPPLGRTIGGGSARRPVPATTPSYSRTADHAPGFSARRPAASLLLHPITEYDGSQRSSVAGNRQPQPLLPEEQQQQQQQQQQQKRQGLSRTALSTPIAPAAQRFSLDRGGEGNGGYGGSNSVPAPPGGRLAAMTPAARAVQPRRLYRSTTAAAAAAPVAATTTPAPQRAHAPPATTQTDNGAPRRSSLFRVAPLAVSTASYIPAMGAGQGRGRAGARAGDQQSQQLQPAAPLRTADLQRHQSLHQRLRTAARLVDSVQLGPMSAFDEGGALDRDGVGGGGRGRAYDNDDSGAYADGKDQVAAYEEEEEADGDADDGDNDADDDDDDDGSSPQSARRPRQAAGWSQQQKRRPSASQPRPLPWQRQRAGGGLGSRTPLPNGSNTGRIEPASASTAAAAAAAAAATNATTTTPLAPLPTPFARRLRAAYGGGAAGERRQQRSRLAVATEAEDAAEEGDEEEDEAGAAAAPGRSPTSPQAFMRSPRSPRSPRVVVTSPRVVTFAERMAEGRRRGGEQAGHHRD